MDGINSDTSIKKTTPKVASNGINSSNAGVDSVPNSPTHNKVVKTNLPNISEVSARISNSSPDVRSDAIERAKILLADPNWLSDENLDRLASKISEVEEI